MTAFTSIIAFLGIAHILGDFFLQPRSWVRKRDLYHLKAGSLYFHSFIHTVLSSAVLFIDTDFWWIPPIILVSHFLIDLAKSYTPEGQVRWFVLDQLLHMVVIVLIASLAAGFPVGDVMKKLIADRHFLVVLMSYLLVLNPASIFVGIFTQNWRLKIENIGENSLKNAGMWIGFIERVLILTFVFTDHFEAIGFLLTAKSIFRFGELKDKEHHSQMEYILIGTLLSFGIAIGIGILAVHLISL